MRKVWKVMLCLLLLATVVPVWTIGQAQAESESTPVSPAGLLIAPGDTSAHLIWNRSAQAVSYTVKRSDTSGGPYATVASSITMLGFKDTGLANDKTYYYIVTAINESGESAPSEEAAVTPTAMLIDDGFEGVTTADPVTNGTLAGYTVSTTVSDTFAQIVSQSPPDWEATIDNRAIYLQDANASKGIKILKLFNMKENKVIVGEVDFRQDTSINATLQNNTKIMRLLDSKGSAVIADIETTNGSNGRNIYLRVGSNYYPIIPAVDYVPGKWYHIRVEVDLAYTLKGVNVTITDGSQTWKLEGQTMFQTGTVNIGGLDASTSDGNPGYIHLDNVKVYEKKTAPPSFGNFNAYAGNAMASLNWERVPGSESYNISRSGASDGPFAVIATGIKAANGSTTVLNYIDDNGGIGLVNDETYYYRVTALNAYGETISSVKSAAPSASITPPAVPSGLRAVARDSMATLQWDAVPDAIRYILKRSSSIDGLYANVSPSAPITGTSYRDTGLTNETPYYYKISSFSTGGESVESAPILVVPTSAMPRPANLQAAAGDGEVKLAWSAVTAAVSYQVKRSTVNGGPYTLIGQTAGTSYTDITAASGTTYYYVVTAVGAKSESMISNQAKAKPYTAASGAPGVPSGLAAAAHEGKVALSWQPVAEAESYTVKRKAIGDSAYSIIANNVAVTAYEDTTVSNGTAYAYVVTADKGAVSSPESDEALAQPAEVITVDQSGGGDFTTIQAAVNSIGSTNAARKVIYIKNGTYREKITVGVPNVSFVGESREGTVIVYGDYAGPSGNGKYADGTPIPGISSTFDTPTAAITGNYFTAANLTIANDAGPRDTVGTAVALSVKSDQSIFDNVSLLGYQDTLYNGSGRQYFHNSTIAGDVDFIFGEAKAIVIDDSDIVSREHPDSTSTSGGYVTAAAQTNATDPGYIFFDSRLIKDESATGSHYLGRPWKNNPSVRFINTVIDDHIVAAGWKSWNVAPKLYAEYNSTGFGANAIGRDVTLSTQLAPEEASALTIPAIFEGWDPTQRIALPMMAYKPTLGQTSAIYDKNTVKASDLNITAAPAGDTLESVTNGSYTLLKAADYAEIGSGYTIKRAYLDSLDYGIHELQFRYASGTIAALKVKVIDTTMLESLGAGTNGWATYGSGISGGASASTEQIFVVGNRKELVEALGGASAKTNAAPKIIFVKGTIDMNVDDSNNPLGYEDYRDPAYTLQAYLETYDPAVCGWEQLPSGTLETARRASQLAQAARIKVNVGPNTTIIGLGSTAKIVGGNLNLESVHNIIIRNIEFQNAYDYFPQWDPTDGSSGNWNSQYDNITIKTAERIWIDHNSFNDETGDRFSDGAEGVFLGRHYQHHDGFVDITNNADLVTLSYNHFAKHDKTMLIGSSDSAADSGDLRVTIHHNYFEDIVQRVPRVRFGLVHIYNNYYNSSSGPDKLYSIGVGVSSQIYSEANYFENVRVPVAYYDSAAPGAIKDVGSLFVNSGIPVWKPGVIWNPADMYSYAADGAEQVKAIVLAQAGAEGRTLTAAGGAARIGLEAAVAGKKVKLTWDTVPNATRYIVKRSETSGGPYAEIGSIAVVDATLLKAKYDDKDVTAGKTYYYVVTAAGSTGEFVSWSEASAQLGAKGGSNNGNSSSNGHEGQ